MEQTAVEKFIEQLEKQGESWENVSMGTINISIKVDDYLKLKTQAKEIEEQQSQAYAAFCINCDRKSYPIVDFESYLKL